MDMRMKAECLYQEIAGGDFADEVPNPNNYTYGTNDSAWLQALINYVKDNKIRREGSDKLLIEEDEYKLD